MIHIALLETEGC